MSNNNTDDSIIYKDDIELYLNEYCISRNIEDPRKIPAPQWSACLIYIYNHCIKNTGVLFSRADPKLYDSRRVNSLCNRYIYLCYDYNQRISIEQFCFLSGIDLQTIYDWKNKTSRRYIYINNNGEEIGGDVAQHLKPEEFRRVATPALSGIYEKLVYNAINISDDLVLSRPGVNSIAYANRVRERYNTPTAPEAARISSGELAEALGIGEQLALLEDSGQ